LAHADSPCNAQDWPYNGTRLCVAHERLRFAYSNWNVSAGFSGPWKPLFFRRTQLMHDEPSLKDKMTLYEDGKHRRYSLLFSVNGGAFAVAKILVGTEGKHAEVLGQLRLSDLSWGMILFTAIMAADIYAFGYKMRKTYLREAFDWRGKLVLISLALLICIGWYLVGRPPGTR
jgi:hypothetical protein